MMRKWENTRFSVGDKGTALIGDDLSTVDVYFFVK